MLGLEGDLLALQQLLVALGHDSGEVHEHVLAAVVGSDEAVALFCVEPLDSTAHFLFPPYL